MVVKDSVKDFVAVQVIKGMAQVAPHLPDEAVASIASRLWLNKITAPQGKEAALSLLLTAKRVLRDMPKESRAKVVQSLFINQMLLGHQIRKEVAEREGVSIPTFIAISPSMVCNLRCVGCYAGNYTRSEELDFATVDRIMRELKEMGIYYINVAGGEPFAWKGILELLEKHNDVFFQIFTNGTLLGEEACRRLGQLGNTILYVSVEGFEEETDQRRGKGVTKKILQAMANLRKNKVPFGFSATPLRENNELMVSDEFIDFWVRQQGCCSGWYFNYIPIGWKPSLELMPTPEQRLYRWQRLAEIREKYSIFVIDFWNDGAIGGFCMSGGHRYLHITNHGDVEPCIFVHFATDNIKNKTLLEVLKTSPIFQAIRKRRPWTQNLLRPCIVIDHPHILREVVAETRAYPTHPGAESVITDMAQGLDEYSAAYGKLADEVWQREFRGNLERVTCIVS